MVATIGDGGIVAFFLRQIIDMDKRIRVLIIDDDETFGGLIAELLERKGMEAVWTSDSLAGYEISRKRSYDLFILDVRMPGLLGTELAEGLKENNPEAKIILISAFADEGLRKQSQNLGVSLLSKPFSAIHLLEEVKKTLGRQA